MNTGNNLLFLTVSAMLAFMAMSGLLGWLNIRYLAVSLRLPDEIYAGRETLVGLSVQNRKRWLPSFLINTQLCGVTSVFTMLDAGKSEEGSFITSFDTRGRHHVDRPLISSPFPVNFFVRFTRAPISADFTVFPAPRSASGLFASGTEESGIAAASRQPGYEGDLAKISDYRGGESLKLIHWRLSAKHEVFKVKELTATAEEPVILEVDLLPGRDLEERLGVGTYLINALIKRGRAVGLKIGEDIIQPGASRAHRLKMLGELATYGQN
ncbi:DUF58 domain-containing protein [Geomesophilobacter sediminis]|uniref:DUF58 domain-containing protein n=1 Tax=Geomesophilobacter sediminis TaxID=2798584 RepID=UPI002E2B9D13|nr:DUF58 domain-containing protein [Geomesophilobacter sediminis]